MQHDKIEKNVGLMGVLVAIVVAIGGIVEIVPLMFQAQVVQPLPGQKPYPALELAGRDVYLREGCYGCHSQMVRTLRFETERYGHYSLAAESMYDHPFQWGSKRTGPDLARVGGKYSNDWQWEHLVNPRAVVPESIMPGYPFLRETELRFDDIAGHLKANAAVGVPYTPEMIDNARADLVAQATGEGAEELARRYARATAGDFDGQPGRITEMDALVAYLQMLGTLVDFSTYKAEANLR